MDDKQFAVLSGQLIRIADALERLVQGSTPQEPNLIKPLEEYAGFNWETIGATVVREDPDGATHVEWGGFIWTRRSPSNKYDPAIWYSRASGKDEDGTVHYLRLITFRTIKDADPIPGKVVGSLGDGKSQAGAQGAAAPGKRPAQPTQAMLPDPALSREGSKARPKEGPMDATTYYAEATGKRFNLSREAAAAIARMYGVDTMDSKADFAKAWPALPYFAECKANGLDFKASLSTLTDALMDLEQALLKMREQHALEPEKES
jgi:hypothetical protein